MEISYEPLDVPFLIADASWPQLSWDGNQLHVSFRDGTEKPVKLRFENVVGFSWDNGEAALDLKHEDDCCYVVTNSPWLQRHREVGELRASDEHRHFKLCFNAAGILQVLASRMDVLARRPICPRSVSMPRFYGRRAASRISSHTRLTCSMRVFVWPTESRKVKRSFRRVCVR